MVATYDEIVRCYSDILSIPERLRIQTLIKNLDQRHRTATYFTDTIKYLPVMKHNKETNIVQSIYPKGKEETLCQIAKGGAGKIYKIVNEPFVYKEIVITKTNPEELEQTIRELFLEVFLQTVLHKDEKYGHHIPKIISVFRSEHTFILPRQFSMYIKMVYIPYNLPAYISSIQHYSKLEVSEFMPFILHLCEILTYFQETYALHHRDLHTENILFSRSNDIRIIDFGFSNITFDGITYGVLDESIVSERTLSKKVHKTNLFPIHSHDILIFLASFLYRYSKLCTDELCDLLLDCFRTNDGINIYRYSENIIISSDSDTPVYYFFYDWIMEERWCNAIRLHFNDNILHFTPEAISNRLKHKLIPESLEEKNDIVIQNIELSNGS